MNDSNNPWDRLILILMAMVMVPALLPQVRDTAVTWLLEHQVLVAADQALIQIPTTSAGIDLRRILALALLVGLIVCLRWSASVRSPQEQSR